MSEMYEWLQLPWPPANVATVAKDAITAVVAILALCVATSGLKTWKRQIHGSSQYSVAKAVLLETYRVEELIADVRHPLMTYPREEVEKHGKRYVIAKVYEARLQPLLDSLVALRGHQLEAAAIWGKEIKSEIEDLETMIRELRGAIMIHLDQLGEEARYRGQAPDEALVEMQKAAGKKLYAIAAGDDFADRVERAVKRIERKYKPFMSS